MHLTNKKDKGLTSFRKAFTIPFFVCLLTIIIPYVKMTFEWMELKSLDFLFTLYPYIYELTFNNSKPSSPTVIITKDQSFQTLFGRNSNRSDFAKLLNVLKKQNVKTAAFDFIFDEPNKPDDDNAFIEALDKFPYPIIGYNFVGRGQQNFSLVDIYDPNSSKATGFVNLYAPIARKAVTRGLLNIPADIDSTIRYAPLAYHLDSDRPDMFFPSLGFSTWIISLLSEKENHLNKLDFSKCSNIEEAFNILNKQAPYDYNSVGHLGLDKTIKRMENRFLYRFITKKYPKLTISNQDKYIEFFQKLENSNKTWIRLPQKPLPIIGDYDTPSIRLPFQKLLSPFKGDGVEVISMTRLIPKENDENSPYLFSKNQLGILPDEPIQKIKPVIPTQSNGNNSLYGEIKRINGKPVTEASIWAVMVNTGYWEKAKPSTDGKYRFDNLPEGNYIINVFIPTENGCDKAILSIKSDQKEKEIPLLLLDTNINSIEIPSEIIPKSNESEIWVYGDINPMIKSNNDGDTTIKNLPEGFYLAGLDDNDSDEEQKFSLNNDGKLLLNNNIGLNTLVAVLPIEENEKPSWLIHFYRKTKLKEGQKNVINNLPSSLATIINVTNNSTLFSRQDNLEIEIKPGIENKITKLPRIFRDYKTNINLAVSFINNASDSKVILLSDSGKEYEIKNESTLDIPNDKYIVLTQSGSLRGLHKGETIDKKTVFIGTSMPTDQDFVNTPINFLDKSFTKMAGVHIHANLYTALSENRFLYSPPFHMDRAPNSWPFLQFLLILPILIILNIKLKNAKSTKSTLIILLLVSLIYLSSIILFPKRIIIPVFYPSFLIISFGIARGFIEWINFRRQANETQSAFSRFISADVVAQIINNPNAIKPGGEKKELTIMFTDIAGFTSISEKLDAEALTSLMNSYLDEMTKILFKHGGTLDKYVGDAIMGFWNHPTPQEDHTTRAVSCAIEMQKKLKEMRENWIAQGLPKVEMRAGINTGNCMVGFIGSTIQMNFTCLGDNVNLASRLEGANKAYGTFIMVSESVKKQLNPYLFSTRFLDFLAVKGKNEPVLVYEVRGFLNEESQVWLEKAGKIYQEGIDKYLTRKWDKAIALFNEVLSLVPDDSPSKVYIERCEHFKLYPPEANWDGRFILKTK